jgi:Beta-propeller repeat
MVLVPLLFLAVNYTTYLGGSGPDVASGIAVDYAGAVYVAGTSSSTNFPVTSTTLGGPTAGHHCGFITKMAPDGSAPEFSVCIPDLIINAFAMDPSGAMYIAVTNLDYSQSVLKLDRNAQTIVYSTPMQGVQINAIAVDAYGTAYVAGSGYSLATTPGAYQQELSPGTCHGGAGVGMSYFTCPDAFVAKLSRAGSIAYATYIGGSGPDTAAAIAIDAFGDAWITGTTVSPNFPTLFDALQNQFHGEVDLGPLRFGDAFVAELDPAGSTLLYSTYLGGAGVDYGNAIAVDGMGAVYITGFTQSPNFPTTAGTLQTTFTGNAEAIPDSSGNGFLVKLSAAGNLVYSTYLPGVSYALAINAQRQALLNQSPLASYIAFDGSYVACSANTYGSLIASDGTDRIYSAGTTYLYAPSIATPGAFQTAYGGGDSDVVVQASDASRCFQAPAR